MNKKIVIEPLGGLGNRLMALLSSMRIAHHYKAALSLYWSRGPDCCADFKDLFSTDLQEVPFRLKKSSLVRDCSYADGKHAASRVVASEDFSGDKPLWLATNTILTLPEDNVDEDGYILADPVVGDLGRYFNALNFSPEVRARLAKYANFDFSKTVGVHIRRPYPANSTYHEMEKRLRSLPTDEGYANVVIDLLKKPYCDRVFLCTNDFLTQKTIIDAVGSDRVFVHPKTTIDNAEDSEAVVDALVDMVLLSRCAMTVRGLGSTFSYMASLIGFKPSFEIYQKDKDSRVGFSAYQFSPMGTFDRVSFGEGRKSALEFFESTDSLTGALQIGSGWHKKIPMFQIFR